MYRRSPELQVFLIHPGGPFYAHKQEAVWSLPKGLVEEGEDDLAAAVREFTEETGIAVDGPYEALGEVTYSNGKHVAAWAVEHDCPAPCVPMSNTFTLEWPRGSGRLQEFPEADDGRYFGLDEARDGDPAGAGGLPGPPRGAAGRPLSRRRGLRDAGRRRAQPPTSPSRAPSALRGRRLLRVSAASAAANIVSRLSHTPGCWKSGRQTRSASESLTVNTAAASTPR